MTNATKAVILGLVNAGLTLVTSFGVTLTDAQTAAVTGFVNAALVAWVALTFKKSPKRVPDR